MKHKIIKDKTFLRKGTRPVSSIEEGEEIAKKLVEALSQINHLGLGLSANQIGINKSVAVVKVGGELTTLINPVVTKVSKEKFLYTEGCLSLPGRVFTTVRHKNITVECLNWANPRTFGTIVEDDKEILLKNVTNKSLRDDIADEDHEKKDRSNVLESVVVQHQLGLLDGTLINDPTVKFNKQVVKSGIDHGRNDKVMIEKDGQTQFIKYKKVEPLLSIGWKIV